VERWAVQCSTAVLTTADTFRICCRRVSIALKSVYTNGLFDSICLPNDSFRQTTARSKAGPAELFARPGTPLLCRFPSAHPAMHDIDRCFQISGSYSLLRWKSASKPPLKNDH
jgi:hypothetical protein